MKQLDKKKRIILVIIGVLILTIGVTLAFIIARIQDSAKGNASVTSDTTDNLRFEIDKEITFNPNQFNVTEGGSGLSDTAVGSAILRANSTDNNATYTYYVYFQINSNNYVYTTTDQKPEIVLTILDPNDNPVTSVNNLKYVEVTNANGSEVKGFDITTKSGLFNIASLYEITSTSSTEDTIHEWTFTVTFINLDTNQYENGGKTMEAEVILSKELYTMPDVTLAAFSNGVSIDHVYNKNYTVTSNCSNVSWNNKYQGVDISFNDSIPLNCNLEYTENNTTTYLNDYIVSLSGTTQGTGQVVDEENAFIPDYTSAPALTEPQYGTVSMYSSSSDSSTSGTTTTGTFTYNGDEWSSVPSTMTFSTYYHFMFTPEESGYYQICYNISAGSIRNRLYVYVNTTSIISDIEASTSSTISRCQNLGYLSTDDYIRVVQKTSPSIATISFSIKKTNTVNEVDTGYRYEGKDPNNYIWFNNELWRIIGVFDEASHGVSGQNLVKIIRANSIGGLSWDKDEENDWTTSSLMNLLNGAYLNSENGTGGEYCYLYNDIPSNCDYTETGINDTYRPMIENVTWQLGGHSSTSATADTFYTAERGTTVYSGRPTSTTGYIGLMYVSDYGYSVLASSCARTTNLGSYGTAACSGQSWLFGQGTEWTITPYSSRSYVFHIRSYGYLFDNSVLYANHSVRPVLYLDSSVYVIDGNGSISDPYIIGM